MSNRHPKGRLEGNWHVEYEPNMYTPGRRKETCKFYDMDKKCCCNIVAPDFSVRCRPGQCGYYEYGKPISEKNYKIQKQMMIQKEMANMSVGSHSSHKKNKKGQQKHPSGIKKHWGTCKAVVVLEIHNNGENIQKTFYLEKPGTRTPTTFANVCSQAHANDIVWFNGLKYQILRFKQYYYVFVYSKFHITSILLEVSLFSAILN